MATATIPTLESRQLVEPIPPLENGDRMSRPEFERRYNAMPDARAELVDGIVWMPSPIRGPRHGRIRSHVAGWLSLYRLATPGVDLAIDTSIRLDTSSILQPDLTLLIQPDCGGQVRVSEDDFLEGAPDLIVEVLSGGLGNRSNYSSRFNAYRRNGVKEYIVWYLHKPGVSWFVLDRGQYVSMRSDHDGIYRSRVMPGLWLDRATILYDDHATKLRVNAQGTTTAEHAAFVERLRLARTGE